jgi:glycosyltransferase involved in cell wall biosynthesis
MPRVLVTLTSYNHEKYIREAIESVLNQTYKDFLLLIYDDASTDNSWEIINSYEDPRIHPMRNETNKAGDFFQITPRNIPGDFIAVHHSDDSWEPTKLEKQVEVMDNHPEIAAVFTLVKLINEEGKPFTDKSNLYYQIFNQPNRSRFEWLNHFFYKGNALCHPSLLLRANSIADLKLVNGLAQLPDFDRWIQLCLKHEIYVLQEKLTSFRIRENEMNVSGDKPEARIRLSFEYLKILEHYKTIPDVDQLVKIFPEAEQYITPQNPDILFALGMLSAETGINAPIRLFGLNLLFDAINDPKRAQQLQEKQGFNKKSFIELTGKNDIFNIEILKNNRHLIEEKEKQLNEIREKMNELNQQNQNNNKVIQSLKQELQDKDQEILFYALSKSWRFTRPFRKIANALRRLKNVKNS